MLSVRGLHAAFCHRVRSSRGTGSRLQQQTVGLREWQQVLAAVLFFHPLWLMLFGRCASVCVTNFWRRVARIIPDVTVYCRSIVSNMVFQMRKTLHLLIVYTTRFQGNYWGKAWLNCHRDNRFSRVSIRLITDSHLNDLAIEWCLIQVAVGY